MGAVLFLISCKKDCIPLPDAPKGPQTFGWAKAKRNGQDWEASSGWGYIPLDSSKFGLSFETAIFNESDSSYANIETLTIQFIPFEGVYDIKEAKEKYNREVCVFVVGYLDEIDAYWTVNDRKKNTVNITSYDPVTKTVKGTFNLYFNGGETGDYPSSISFEDGTFEARLFN